MEKQGEIDRDRGRQIQRQPDNQKDRIWERATERFASFRTNRYSEQIDYASVTIQNPNNQRR